MKIISDAEIASVLRSAKTIAVAGASGNPSRDSYSIADFLLKCGYNVIPVNPNYETVLGRRCYPSLLDIGGGVDIVDVLRRPEEVSPIVEDAIRIKAGVIWMQPGAYDKSAAEKAASAGIIVISHRCIKVDYLSLIGY